MKLSIHNIEPNFNIPNIGSVLISEPFLKDYNFRRSVVIVCDHNKEGSVGFILNRLNDLTINDVIPGMIKYNFPLFFGGPMESNTLHFIHKVGDLVTGTKQIAEGIYWGGDIKMIEDLIDRKVVSHTDFRFFLGYSGWGPKQLEDEISKKAWWVGRVSANHVFDDDLQNYWSNIVKNLGVDYAYMASAPEDRSWN